MEVARRDQLEEEERRELRAGFAAEVLELGAVLELFAPCTDSSLGRRMLEELTPRDEEDARAALARVDEALLLRKAGDLPGMGGVTDPLPPGMDGQLDFDYSFRRPGEVNLSGSGEGTGYAFLRARANTIEGGTTEVMKNILGEQVLGLPGEPRVDKEIAWIDVPRG